jgi:hypothetical protein
MTSVESEQKDNNVATDEELVQSIQTAAGFAECVVKQLWALVLQRDISDTFNNEDIPTNIGAIVFDAKKGSGQASYSIKLDIVDSTYRIDTLQFKSAPYIFDEMSRLLTAVELYWSYSKKTYDLPELDLWRSDWGTLYVAGAPENMKHIGIRVICR